MEAILREQQDFAMKSMSMTYSPASTAAARHEDLHDATWDDKETAARPVGPKTKKEKHSELVASVLAELLSPAFKDKAIQLQGSDVHAYLAELLQQASLCTDDPAGKQELLQYLKQVVLTVHGVDLSYSTQQPDSNITAAADAHDQPSPVAADVQSRPGSRHSEHTGRKTSDADLAIAQTSLTSMPEAAYSSAVRPSTPHQAVPASDMQLAAAQASDLAAAQDAAGTGALAAEQQLQLMPGLLQGTGGPGGASRSGQLAALISAAASAATTAAAAAVMGVWSQQGAGWGNDASVPSSQAGRLTRDLQLIDPQDSKQDTGQWRDQQQHLSIDHKVEEGSPEPLPHKLDPRIAASRVQQQGLDEANTTRLPPWALERQAIGHPSTSQVRVVKLGQPRITARAAPVPGGDSPVMQGFQDFRPSQQLGVSVAHDGTEPLPLPHMDPVPPPASYPPPPVATARFDQQPGPNTHTSYSFGGGWHQQDGAALQPPARDAVSLNTAERAMSPPRPAFRPPGKLPASPPRPTSMPDIATAYAPPDKLQRHPSPVAVARQQQARQAAASARWDPAQGLLYATTGVQPSVAAHNTFAPQQPQQQANQLPSQQLLVDMYGPRSQTSMSPIEHLKALAEIQSEEPQQSLTAAGGIKGYKGAAGAPLPRAADNPPQKPAPVPRHLHMPQELQQTVHRTLALLSDPAAATPPAAWPPDNRLLQTNERQAVERDLAAQLGGPLDYGKLVQELEQARQQSLLLRPMLRGTPSPLGPTQSTPNLTAGTAYARTAQPTQPADELVTTVALPAGLQHAKPRDAGSAAARKASLTRLQTRQRQKQLAGPSPPPSCVQPTSRLAQSSTGEGVSQAKAPVTAAAVAAASVTEATTAAMEAVLPPISEQTAGSWPPARSVWDDDASWTDMSAYTKAVQQEIQFRAARPSAAGLTAAVGPAHATGASSHPAPAKKELTSYQHPAKTDHTSDGVPMAVHQQPRSGPGAHNDAGQISSPQERASAAIAAAAAARSAAPAAKPKPKVQLAFGQRVPVTGGGATNSKERTRSAAMRVAATSQQQQDHLVQAVVAAVTAALAGHSLTGQPQQAAAYKSHPLQAQLHAALAGKQGFSADGGGRIDAAFYLRDSSSDGGDTVSRVLSALASVLADEDQDLHSSIGDPTEAIHDSVSGTPDIHGRTPPASRGVQDLTDKTPLPSARRALLRVLQKLQQSSKSPVLDHQQAKSDTAAPEARARPQFMHVQDTASPPGTVAVHSAAPVHAAQHQQSSALPHPPLPALTQRSSEPVPGSLARSHPAEQLQQHLQEGLNAPYHEHERPPAPPTQQQQQQQRQEVNQSFEQQDEVPATLPRMWLYGDASTLMSTDQLSHPGHTTHLQEPPVPASLKDALMELLVEDVMGKVIVKQATSAAAASSATQLQHVNSLDAAQPPAVPLMTNANMAYQLVREVLQEHLVQMLAPVSQDQPHSMAAQGGPSPAAMDTPEQAWSATQATDMPQAMPPASRAHDTQGKPAAPSSVHDAVPNWQPGDSHNSSTSAHAAVEAHRVGRSTDDAERLAAVQAGQEAAAAALAAINSAEQAITAGSTPLSKGSASSVSPPLPPAAASQAAAPAPPGSAGAPLVRITSSVSTSSQQDTTRQVEQAHTEQGSQMPGHAIRDGPATVTASMQASDAHNSMTAAPTFAASTSAQAQPSGTSTITIQVPVPFPVPHPYPAAPTTTSASRVAASMPGSTTFTASPHFLAKSASRQPSGPARHAGTRAAGVRQQYNLPGLDQLLLDSTDLDSSADSQAIANAVQQALRGQAAASARAVGRTPPSDLAAKGLEQIMTRRYHEASLEVLLAPRPSMPSGVASSSSQRDPTAVHVASHTEVHTAPQQEEAQGDQAAAVLPEQPALVTGQSTAVQAQQTVEASTQSSQGEQGSAEIKDRTDVSSVQEAEGSQVGDAIPQSASHTTSSLPSLSSPSSATTTAAESHAYSEDSTWQHAAALPSDSSGSSGDDIDNEDGEGHGRVTGQLAEPASSAQEPHIEAAGAVALLSAGYAQEGSRIGDEHSTSSSNIMENAKQDSPPTSTHSLKSSASQLGEGAVQQVQQQDAALHSQIDKQMQPASAAASTEAPQGDTVHSLQPAPSLTRAGVEHAVPPLPVGSGMGHDDGTMTRSPSLPRPPSVWRLQQRHSQELQQRHSAEQAQSQQQAGDLQVGPESTPVEAQPQQVSGQAPISSQQVQHMQANDTSSVAVHLLSDHVEAQRGLVVAQQQQQRHSSDVGLPAHTELAARLAEDGLHAQQQLGGMAVQSGAATHVFTPAVARLPALTVTDSPARLPSLADYTGPVQRLWRVPVPQQPHQHNLAPFALEHDTLLASNEAGSSSTSSQYVAAQHVTITSRSSDEEDKEVGAGTGGIARRPHSTAAGAHRTTVMRISRQGAGSSTRLRGLSERRQRLLQELGIDDELMRSQATSASSTSVSNERLHTRPSH